MGIEQIALFLGGWFAVGFLVALGLGKFLRESDRLGRTEVERTRSSAAPDSARKGRARSTQQRRARIKPRAARLEDGLR